MSILRFLFSKSYREKQKRGAKREVRSFVVFVLLHAIAGKQ
ncbi:MAG: hypothetical protein V4604_09170 [Bacteroidota bacterium]